MHSPICGRWREHRKQKLDATSRAGIYIHMTLYCRKLIIKQLPQTIISSLSVFFSGSMKTIIHNIGVYAIVSSTGCPALHGTCRFLFIVLYLLVIAVQGSNLHDNPRCIKYQFLQPSTVIEIRRA